MHRQATAAAEPRGSIPRDIGAGALLLTLAAIGYFGTRDLAATDSGGIGPGLMPQGVAMLMAIVGVVVALTGIATRHDRVRLGSLRGPIFVLGSVVVFAAAVRPLGLAIAGPIAVIIAALADPDTKPLEALVFAAVMTAFCVGLFKFVLRLPIPLAPVLIGY